MTARLNGKVALISGTGSGMGRAAARLFAAEGAIVELGITWHCTQAAWPHLISRGGGTVLMCGSIAGINGSEIFCRRRMSRRRAR